MSGSGATRGGSGEPPAFRRSDFRAKIGAQNRGEDSMLSKLGRLSFALLMPGLALFTGLAGFIGGALADEPQPWQLGLQPPASNVADRIHAFHSLLVWIITLITLFVLGLLLYVMWRFRESRNPVPNRTAHNTVIEVLWTVIPIMILVIIAIPSFKLLYFEETIPKTDLTVKAIGHQWYWSYEYPDNKISFDSMLPDDPKPGQLRLLDVDNRMILPVHTNIRILIASEDVIHAWIVPSLGLQVNAVPGRLNELWVNVDREGVYYGQCTQLCGVNHGFMPIVVEVVSKDKFTSWAASQKKTAGNGSPKSDEQLARATAGH
jgi:cytochrome c oxidase subunit II